MFSNKAQIPCVGISFGVDRIFSITKARMEREKNYNGIRSTEVDVYVMAFGGKGFTGMLKERMEVAKSLWKAGVKVSSGSCIPNLDPYHAPKEITNKDQNHRLNSATKSSQSSPSNSRPQKQAVSPSPLSWVKTNSRPARSVSRRWVWRKATQRRKVFSLT